MKDKLSEKTIADFAAMGANTFSYLVAKGTRKCVIKKLEFKDYKNCLEANQLGNGINYLKCCIEAAGVRENNPDFIKSKRLITKPQQGFESQEHNTYTEETPNADKRT